MPVALIALAIASFCIGTTEFVIMGLLPDVAHDLGVTIPKAGLLVTGYALGVVVGAPVVAAAIVRVPRKTALLAMAGVFVIGNLLCAVAPNYVILMIARMVTAFCHGAFFGIGSVVAADLVAPNRRASAIALMFGGLTLANVLGVPLGTALGNAFGWRSTFFAIVVIGIVAVLAIARWLPSNIPMKPADLKGEVRVLGNPHVLLALLISVVSSASLFGVFTYITPLLESVTVLKPNAITYALLVFGIGLTVGNIAGGRLADWRLMPSLLAVFIALFFINVAFAFTSHFAIQAFVTLFVWGCLAFAVVPLLQVRIVNEAASAPESRRNAQSGCVQPRQCVGRLDRRFGAARRFWLRSASVAGCRRRTARLCRCGRIRAPLARFIGPRDGHLTAELSAYGSMMCVECVAFSTFRPLAITSRDSARRVRGRKRTQCLRPRL